MAKEKSAPRPAREHTPSSDNSDSESDYSSDDTVEDEDGEELTPAMDAAILRTLAKIRRKDQSLYGKDRILDAELEASQAAAAGRALPARTAQRKEDKPFLLKDLHRNNLLEGIHGNSDEEEEEPVLTNVQVVRKARADAVSAFQAFAGSDSEDEDDEKGGMFKREVDEEEEAAEEEEYRKFLLEMGGGEAEVRRALGMADGELTNFRADSDEEEEEDGENDSKAKVKAVAKKEAMSQEERDARDEERRTKRAQADEDFLMDYILNRGWIDRTTTHVPTYDEIVGRGSGKKEVDADSDDEEEGGEAHQWAAMDEEDEFDERADQFETEYNFRFEEPGSAAIITHPRIIPELVRREDDTRKLKREAKAERKAAEKAAREEETRRLKGEKRREMERQLNSLKGELGEDGMDWERLEKVLDGEFDDDEWDRVVGDMLHAKAAAEAGEPIEEDDEKPTWDDDIGGDYDDYNEEDMELAGGEWVEPVAWDEDEEGPINMDADFDHEPTESKRKAKRDKKNNKKRKGAKEADEDEEENLGIEAKAAKVKKAMEEYRALDHEDEVGGIKTRFKYVRGTAVTFGMTPAEILMATDAELNAIASVKSIAPYRKGGLGRTGYGLGKRVRDLRSEIAKRKWGDEMPVEKKGPPKKREGGKGANAMPLGPRPARYTAEGQDGGEERQHQSSSASAPKGPGGKRLGKKERLKLAAREGEAPAAPVAPESAGGKRKREHEAASEETPAAQGERDGEGKKKRRKKKKSAVEA